MATENLDYDAACQRALDDAFALLEDAILHGVASQKNSGPGVWKASRGDNTIVVWYEVEVERSDEDRADECDAPWTLWGGDELVDMATSVRVGDVEIHHTDSGVDRSLIPWGGVPLGGELICCWAELEPQLV